MQCVSQPRVRGPVAGPRSTRCCAAPKASGAPIPPAWPGRAPVPEKPAGSEGVKVRAQGVCLC